jgi:hypothetical protein
MESTVFPDEFIGFGYDQIERESKIKRLLEDRRHSPTQPVWQQKFMNQVYALPIIQLPIELPMYRLQNGRTLSLQDEYLAIHHDLSDDFFYRDMNSPEAQSIQHSLLMKLNENREIFSYFKNPSNVQVDPLICTNSGFIVNGNRRLSCWRTLYYEDKKTYKHLEYISIAVLPECDEKAIEQLEANLQIAPDIKEDYAWHTQVKLMKKHRDVNGEDLETIAKFFTINSGKEVNEWLDMLTYADEYLKWNGWDRQWSKVTEAEYVFRGIVQNRKGITSFLEKAFFEKLAFSYLNVSKNDTSIEGRLYTKIPELRKYLPKIKIALTDELNIQNETIDESDDDSALLLGNESASVDGATISITKMLEDAEIQKDAVKITEAVIEEQKSIEREKRDKNYLMEKVRKANTFLQDAIIAATAPNNQGLVVLGLDNQLDTIRDSVCRLKEWLKQHGTSD